MAKKKKNDYRFSRAKIIKASNQPRVPVDSEGRVLSDSKEHLPVNYLFSESGPALHQEVSFMGAPSTYESPAEGESPSWITFIGYKSLSLAPSRAAVVVINGNSNKYDAGQYQRFADTLFITINSGDEWRNPNVTEEMCKELTAFNEKHRDVPIYVQCSAGEQRSAAIASGMADHFDRYLDLNAPGCIGSIGYLDKGVYRAIHKILHELSKVIP